MFRARISPLQLNPALETDEMPHILEEEAQHHAAVKHHHRRSSCSCGLNSRPPTCCRRRHRRRHRRRTGISSQGSNARNGGCSGRHMYLRASSNVLRLSWLKPASSTSRSWALASMMSSWKSNALPRSLATSLVRRQRRWAGIMDLCGRKRGRGGLKGEGHRSSSSRRSSKGIEVVAAGGAAKASKQ